MSILTNSPQMNTLVVNFATERMLGRPIRNYNLIIMCEEGNRFSSSDNRFELVKYLKNFEKRHPNKIDNVSLWYLVNSIKRREGTNWFMIVSEIDFEQQVGDRHCKLDRFEYLCCGMEITKITK
jgi:hypothetical protein